MAEVDSDTMYDRLTRLGEGPSWGTHDRDCQEAAEAAVVFSREWPTLGGYTIGRLIVALGQSERFLHRLAELACNGELSEEEQEDQEQEELEVRGLMAGLCEVRFQNDPRGGYICLVLPSGRYNSMDGETWRITWDGGPEVEGDD